MRVRPMVGSVAGQRRPRAPRSPPTGGCAWGGDEGPPGTQRVASRLRSTGSACALRVRRADVALLHPGLLYPPPSLLLAPGNPWTVLTWTSLSVLAVIPGDPSVPRLLFHPRGDPAGREGNGESWGSGLWLLGSVVTPSEAPSWVCGRRHVAAPSSEGRRFLQSARVQQTSCEGATTWSRVWRPVLPLE